MASDKLLLLEPQWTDPDIKWYISSRPVKKIHGKSGTAPAGTIFEVDYDCSKLDEKQKKEIVLKGCHKGTWKVKWAPRTFYGLDEDSKNLLLALSDQNDRFRFYNASRESLEYGKTLKSGDDVSVRLPKKKEYLIGGVIKYIGPIEEDSSAIWFGVELVGSSYGDSDGVFKKTGDRYFTCEQGRGIFVTIKNIIPPTVSEQEKEKVSANFKAGGDTSGRSSHAANSVGLDDLPQTPYIRDGDEVTLYIQTERGGQPKLVVGHVALVHDGHVAVNVLESEAQVYKPWNGFYNHKRIYNANKQTVWQHLDEVKLAHSPSSSAPYEDKKDKFSQNMPQKNVWQRSEDGASVSAVTATCRNEMKMNIQETKNLRVTREVTTSQPQSLGPYSMASDVSMSDSRVSSSSSVEMSQKTSERVTRSHSFDESNKYSAGMNSKSQESKANKILKNVMSNFSSLSSSFSRGATPEFPLKDFHIDELSKDRNAVENLVTELELIEKWREICRQEQRDYFRVEFLLKWWWTSHIREGYKEEMKRFTDILAKLGREDLRDHINEVPDFGSFHKTVVFVLTSVVGNKWKKFATVLGLSTNEVNERINTQMQPYEAMNIVLQIWQAKDRGSKKLATVIKACRTVGLDDVAGDIEQGLSEEVLKKIARKVEHKNWMNFGGRIGVSRVRCDAFHKKFSFLSERVYHMLCWWSMKSPLNTDKAEELSHALEACKQGNIAAEELSRGIGKNDLETAACLISDRWQSVAVALVTSMDIDYLTRYENDVEKALHMLNIWKRRQPLSAKNLKEALYSHLMNLDMYRAARQLYDGLDSGTVTHLSRKLCFDWPILAHHFGYSRDEISRRLEAANHVDMSLFVLKEWLHANEGNSTEKTKAKLKDGLIAIGREDLVEWMQRRVEEDVEEKLEKPSDDKQDHASQFRKLDIVILEKVADALNHLYPNDLMKMLEFSAGQLKTYLPKNVHMDEKRPHFAILCSWKRKMRRTGFGELDCFESLIHVLKAYREDQAAAILTDGTSVDPVAFGSQGGAVGGASVPAHQILNVNSMVEVTWGGKVLPGVIQWIGDMKGLEEHGKIAGVELEDFAEVGAGSGKFGDTRYFSCQYGRGLYIPLSRCRPDSRFLTETETYTSKDKMEKEDFGDIECDPVEGYVRPSETVKPEHIGMFKGIQGDHNSCYMDVTLYSMFAFSDIFDAILEYDDTAKTETKNVKDALRETIVNPLRSVGVVRADHVLRFRDLLSLLSSMEGFRTEEKDPEEFIHALLQELLNAKPFLKISQGKNATMDSFVYQIFTDKKKYLDIPTVEDLLHVSFLESDLKLSEVPECFIVQLPRYGKKYKLYDWIIPSLEMDISLLIRDSPRSCNVCGKLAFMECQNCTPEYEDDDIIQSFCGECFHTMHKSKKDHQSNPLAIPKPFGQKYQQIAQGIEDDQIASVTEHLYEKRLMELFSVVCIETSHYVAFVKTGSGEHARWVFFDSMADRRGDQHGYNVPEVSHLKDFEEQMRRADLKDALKRNEDLPKYLKRLLSDAYICFYRPTKSGGDVSPRGRSRKSSEGRREENVPSSQGAAFSAGANLPQQKYENLPKHYKQSYSGGTHSNYANIVKPQERTNLSRTDHPSQKTSRERRRENTQDHLNQPTIKYPMSSQTRCIGTTLSYPRGDAVREECQREIEHRVHHHVHQHQSGVFDSPHLDDEVPMDTSGTKGAASNRVHYQVSGTHYTRSDTPIRTAMDAYTGNVASGVGQRRMEGHSGREELDHPHQPQTGLMGSSDNRSVTAMDIDEPSKQGGDDSHHQFQTERKPYDHVKMLEEEQSSRQDMLYTPDFLQRQNGSQVFSSQAHIKVNQHQRRDDNFRLRSDEGASGADGPESLIKDYVVIKKPEDTSLFNTDAEASARSDSQDCGTIE